MITLEQLQSSDEVADLLRWPFDVSLEVDDEDRDLVQLKPSIPYDVIATDGTGGLFIAYGEAELSNRPILHGTSEGQSGRIASDLSEWLGLLTQLPYWRDLLKFSSGGDLEAMRQTANLLSTSILEEIPDLVEATPRLQSLLTIPSIDDPVACLHRNVHSSDCVMLDEDGQEWESLFNSFSPDVLKRQMER
ncbi:MAG: hypothetical protein AAGJ83_02935 [Planctomycetota bacterium]